MNDLFNLGSLHASYLNLWPVTQGHISYENVRVCVLGVQCEWECYFPSLAN